jgi:hypothetical protein
VVRAATCVATRSSRANSSPAAYNAAIQNFANWFQYHRNRVLAIVGSSTAALVSVDTMRVGYFTINKLQQRDHV